MKRASSRKDDSPSIEVQMTVPFHDLDPMQVVWHGNYLKYFDVARSALFDSLGVNLYGYEGNSSFMYPVIRTSVKYIHPLRHRDVFVCKATIAEARFKVIVDFEIRLVESGQICTEGRGEQVAVKVPEMELLLGIPADVRKALGF
ncbi:acyl-CoA thioester hydrolase [Syntrophus gentianae]|uniref:Acyl-CoA thioester hydrolase n=1 Tax=Syntrophus gentianae TaxID=43775 RepID=A0A1H7WVQ1_9BACT|nr:thioesterase family protein [Syntrophus gentianae]SEM25632.1 acyl-CoA thioester hydrolase [Syntrophus gentianae]